MTEIWTWLALAGLGAFHGLNPGMGWLFAVALGMHRHDRPRRVAVGGADRGWDMPCRSRSSPAPSSGRACSSTRASMRIGCGIHPDRLGALSLALWTSSSRALRHADRIARARRLVLPDGHRAWRRPHAVAGADAALHRRGRSEPDTAGSDGRRPHRRGRAHAGDAGDHDRAMAVAVYEWIGLEILRRAWINVDLVWTLALVGAGTWLLVGAFIAA